MRSFRRLAWIVTGLYWLTLFILTHTRAPQLPKVKDIDKFAHCAAYALLAALIFGSLRLTKSTRAHAAITALAIVMCYGAVDEWLQALPFIHRDCEFSDWTADAAGAAMAVVGLDLVFRVSKGSR